jgi:hypothetical protein
LWTALLLMLLLRFLAHLSNWSHSFVRLFTLTRSALWNRIDLLGTAGQLWDSQKEFSMFRPARTGLFARNLESHGTASPPKKAPTGISLNENLNSIDKSPANLRLFSPLLTVMGCQ